MIENSWDTGTAPVEAKECSHCGSDKFQYHIDPKVWSVIKKLCREVKVEWQALLVGYEEGREVYITDYYIPKQEVTGASVKNLEAITHEFIAEKDIIAGIHSHSDMGVFFSQTDHIDTNMSIVRHNIVVNNKMEYKALSRVDLVCGMVKFIEASVGIAVPEECSVVGLDKVSVRKWPKNIVYGQGHHMGGYVKEPYVPYSEKSALLNETCTSCGYWCEEAGGSLCHCFSTGLRPIMEVGTFKDGRGYYDY